MKKKYCKVTIDGTFCIYNDLKEALSSLEYDIQGLTDEEFEALPEFDGF